MADPTQIGTDITVQYIAPVEAQIKLAITDGTLSVPEAIALAIWLLENTGTNLPAGWEAFTAQFGTQFSQPPGASPSSTS